MRWSYEIVEDGPLMASAESLRVIAYQLERIADGLEEDDDAP